MRNIVKFYLLLFFFFNNLLFASEFCFIKDIFASKNNKIDCIDNKIIFGSFNFLSKNIDKNYNVNNDYNLKILVNYEDQIIRYLDKYCKKEKSIQIKEVINYDRVDKVYKTEIIITCRFKNETK